MKLTILALVLMLVFAGCTTTAPATEVDTPEEPEAPEDEAPVEEPETPVEELAEAVTE